MRERELDAIQAPPGCACPQGQLTCTHVSPWICCVGATVCPCNGTCGDLLASASVAAAAAVHAQTELTGEHPMSVTTPYPAPAAPPPPASPVALDRAREDRLRTTRAYERTALPAELEADLGMLRAHEAMAKPVKGSLLGIAAAIFAGGVVLAAALAGAVHPGAGVPPFLLGLLVGGYVAIQGARIPALRRDKLEMASSLLRRLDLAPDTEVTLSMNLGDGQGTLAQSRDLGGDFWKGTSSEALLYQDAWLSISGRLAHGVALRATRTSLTFQTVDKRKGHQKTFIRTATQWAFQDTVQLQYDPARNPQLPAAGASAAGALRIGPEYQLVGFSNQPGALSLTAATTPRATATNHAGLIANLLAQATGLVDGSGQRVLVDGEAWPAELATEAEMKRRGPSGALRTAFPSPHVAGGRALIGVAVLALLWGVSSVQGRGRHMKDADQAEADLRADQAKLAKLPAKSRDREDVLRRIKVDKESIAMWESGANDYLAMSLGGGIGGLALLGVSAALLRAGRRRAAAAKNA